MSSMLPANNVTQGLSTGETELNKELLWTTYIVYLLYTHTLEVEQE